VTDLHSIGRPAYLVFPSVSTKVFNAFRVYTLDDGTCFLLRDLSINCKSALYGKVKAWAGFFILVYPCKHG
jgi:hypothetical protein